MAVLLSTNGNLEPTDNLSGNLGVTGTTNLNTLTASTSTINGNLNVTGITSVNNLTVTGTTNISTLVSTASTINGNLTVTGNTILNALTATTSTINGNLTVTGSTNVRSLTSTASTVNGNLTVTGSTNLSSLTATTVTATTLNLRTIGSGTSVTNLGVDSSGNVVSGTTQFLKFTADTTITSGYAVRLLENGKIARADFSPTGSTLPIIGIAQQSGTTGSTVQVAVENEISYVQSGLLPGFNYYANTDGSLSLNGNTYMGVALSSTQLNLMFSNPAGNSIPSLSVIDNTITDPANITIAGRYIVPVSGLIGSFVGNQNDYADYDGNLFTFTLPTNNDKAVITTGPNAGNVYIFSTGATSGWTLSSQSTSLTTSNWVSTSSYKQNDMVIYQSVLYQANGDIPANTAFVVGTSGATWKQIGVSGVAEYNAVYPTSGSSVLSSTIIDVPGSTLTLPTAGVYRVYYNINATGTQDGVAAIFSITDSSNIVYNNSSSIGIKVYGAANASVATQETLITVNAATTIKLRWKTNGSGGGMLLVNNANPGSSVFGYEKIAGFMTAVGQSTGYASAVKTANQTIENNTTNITFESVSGNLTQSGGAFTLNAGSTYQLNAAITTTNIARTMYQWFDITNNTWIGGVQVAQSPTNGSTLAFGSGVAGATITPSSNIQVAFRQRVTTAGNTISNSDFTGTDVRAWANITQIGTTSTSAFTGAISPSWNIGNSYPLGTMVVNSGVLYQANSFIPANTAFTSGSSGATWTQIGLLNGQAEYNQVIIPTQTTAALNTTYADVVGGSITLPSAGVYDITFDIGITNSTGQWVGVGLYSTANVLVDGSSTQTSPVSANPMRTSKSVQVTVTGSTTYKLRVFSYSNSTVTISNLESTGVAGNSGQSVLSYNKISGFLPATGSVPTYLQATKSTTQSLLNVTTTTISGWSNIYGTNIGEWNSSTGVFTATKSGVYNVTANLQLDTTTWNAGGYAALILQKNGSNFMFSYFLPPTTGTAYRPNNLTVTTMISLVPTDTMSVTIFNASGNNTSLYTGGNNLTIQELPSRIIR